jgi:hypothetical protein
LSAVLELAEDKSDYEIQKRKENNKLIKNILKDTKEMANIINESLKLDYVVKADDLIIHTNSYINRNHNFKAPDIIYKTKKKEVFFLIQYQSYTDKRINLHILNHCIDIINDWCRENRFKKDKIYPVVIPIIIYTGKKEWKIKKIKNEDSISHHIYDNYKIDITYNLVDIQRTKNSHLKEIFSFIF